MAPITSDVDITASAASSDATISSTPSGMATSSTTPDMTASAATSEVSVLSHSSADVIVSGPPTALVPGPLESFRNDVPPEIASLIALHLGQADIARCCRVSSRWNWLWTRDLWTHIQITTPLQCRRFGRIPRMALLASLYQLRSFESSQGLLHGQLLLSGAAGTLGQLESLQLTFPDIQALPVSEMATILEITKKARQLIHLSLFGIRRLSPVRGDDPRSASAMLWIDSNVLQSLFVDFDVAGWMENGLVWPFGPNGVLPVLPALEHFSASGLISEELLVAFLQRCPNLVVLEIHRDRAWPAVPVLLSAAVRRMTNLRSLCYDVPGITDEMMNLFLGGIRWRSLSFSPSGSIGDLSRATLMNSAPILESVVVEGIRGFGGDFLQEFFVAAESLRTFSGLTFSRPMTYEFDLTLDAQQVQYQPTYSDFVLAGKVQEENEAGESDNNKKDKATADPFIKTVPSVSWSCMGLENLAINFGEIPRSDLYGWNDDDSGTPRAVVTFQQDHATEEIEKIYGQLAQLTSLKELCLGHGPRSKVSPVTRMPRRNRALSSGTQQAEQLRCISLSLTSGLDRLSGLKKLRTLDVSKMAHKIGVEELEWMRLNWPVLHSIVGLEDRVGIPVPDKWQGEHLQGVKAWMAKHPYGIGSAFPSLP